MHLLTNLFISFVVGGNGTSKRSQAKSSQYLPQDIVPSTRRLSSSGFQAIGIRPGILSRRGSGTSEVRQDRMERALRL